MGYGPRPAGNQASHRGEVEPEIAVDGSVRLPAPGSFHADPADRLIVATARHWGVPLLTADDAILDYGARGHVRTVDAGK